MALSYVTYTGNGAITAFAITFNYLPETVEVSAAPEGIIVHLDNIKQTSGYTVDTVTNHVNFVTAPLDTVEVKILRATPRRKAQRLVDFADGTILNEAQLDTSTLQLLYIAQEAFEQSSSGGSPTPNYLPYDEIRGWWDAVKEGTNREINNVKAGLLDNSAATKKYVDDVHDFDISGVPQYLTFTGTGTTTNFTLTGVANANAKMLVVALDGVLQRPTDDFSVTAADPDSTLVFNPPGPGDGVIISVQNFGKMRFLDGLELTDGQVTTAALDQTVGSEAVTTATMRDDAVTAAKIADASVDLARIDAVNFTTAVGSGTPRFLSVDPSATALGLDTLKTENIENFNTDLRAQNSINQFAAPTANWNNNYKRIMTLGEPSAATDAATRSYVDAAVAAAVVASGLTKLQVVDLWSTSTSFVELNAFNNTLYDAYLIDIVGVETDDMALGILFKLGGNFIESDYLTRYVCTGGADTLPATAGVTTYTGTPSTLSKAGYLTPRLDDYNMGWDERERHGVANLQIEFPRAANSVYEKAAISRGYTSLAYVEAPPIPGPPSNGPCDFTIKTVLTGAWNHGPLTSVGFGRISGGWMTKSGIKGGARFILYGRKY